MKMNIKDRNIFIIGPRASGKTTTSHTIYKYLDYDVISTDLLISYENNGKSIRQIILENSGSWTSFREQEFKIIKKISKLSRLVVDTGGGIIVDLDSDGNEIFSKRKADILKNNGVAVYLKADSEWLWEAICNDPDRPSLSSPIKKINKQKNISEKEDNLAPEDLHDRKDIFIQIMTRRLPWYNTVSAVTIDATKKDPKVLAEEVISSLRELGFPITTPE
jgi:shikimate kinase